MSQYQPLQVFTESDSDDDWDEDESFPIDSSGRARKLCRCTKKRLVCCGLLFALLVLLTAIAGGVAAVAYYLTRPLNAGGGAAPAVSSSVSSSRGQVYPPTSNSMTFPPASPSGELSPMSLPPTPTLSPTFSTPASATSKGTTVMSTTLSPSMPHPMSSSILRFSSSYSPSVSAPPSSPTPAVSPSPTHSSSASYSSSVSSSSVSSSSVSSSPVSSSSVSSSPVSSSSVSSSSVSSSPVSSSSVSSSSISSSVSSTIMSSSLAFSSSASSPAILPSPSSSSPAASSSSAFLSSSISSSAVSSPAFFPSPSPSSSLFISHTPTSSSSLPPTPSPTPKPGQCSYDAEVCKGASNPLQYRVITLPNELRVLLISNNKTSTAGAAMDVRSGSFQDTIPGLAHFCEHMLFLGTEKYPDESEYAQFLSSNGGIHNAYTEAENTNYYFSVNSEKLEEALDRFSQFFISPLFNADAVDREISAVNSEYEKDKGIPGWHVILLMSRVADPRSAYSRFTIGNTETLAIPDIRDQVTAYYNKRYSSNLMQLVIYGKEDLDRLQSWANATFSSIPNKSILPPRPPNPAYPAGFSPRLIVYKPLTSTPQLNIVWQTPPRQDLYRYGVESFVTTLFAYSGNGSLSHYLKITNPWATALLLEKSKDTSGFALFSFIIALTQDGVANIEDVVAGVFGYIEMLKGSDDEELSAVWEGKNKLDKINFIYASPPSDVSSYAKDLAATMRTVKDPADFLAPPRRTTWDVRQVRSFLDNLTPDKSNIFFANPSLVYDNETAYPSIHGDCTHPTAAQHDFNVSSADLVEPYFDTMYAIYCTDTNLLQKWENPDIPEGTFVLPHFETYTPHNFTLLPLPKDHSKVPQLALDDKQAGYRVWWMQDYQFSDPVVIVKCQAYTGAVAATVRDKALSVLYSHYVSELLTGVTEKAAAASYKVNLELLPSGIAVQFSGYSDPDVVRRFIDDVLQGALVVSEASIMAHSGTLSLAYQQTLTVLRNYQSSKVPYDYAVDLAKLMLLDPRYLQADLLDELSKLNVTELPAVVAEHMGNVLKSVSRTECYATGNVDQDGAIMYSRKIMEKLTQSATSEKKQEENVRVVKLKQGTTALAVRTLNPQVDVNSAIMMVTEVGPMCDVTDDPKNGSSVTCSEESLQTTVFSNVLSLIMSEACFDTLRTKEQLGYVVQCGATPMENSILTLYFLVQSSKSPPYLLDRIDNFTDAFFYDTVLDAKLFEAGLSTYKTLLQAEDKTLEEQVDRLWTLIHNQHYNFDLKETMLAVTKRVSHSQFADFYEKYVLGDLDVHATTTVRELVVGAFSGTVGTVSFDVPDQVKQEDQYYSASEFKESAEYWDL